MTPLEPIPLRRTESEHGARALQRTRLGIAGALMALAALTHAGSPATTALYAQRRTQATEAEFQALSRRVEQISQSGDVSQLVPLQEQVLNLARQLYGEDHIQT